MLVLMFTQGLKSFCLFSMARGEGESLHPRNWNLIQLKLWKICFRMRGVMYGAIYLKGGEWNDSSGHFSNLWYLWWWCQMDRLQRLQKNTIWFFHRKDKHVFDFTKLTEYTGYKEDKASGSEENKSKIIILWNFCFICDLNDTSTCFQWFEWRMYYKIHRCKFSKLCNIVSTNSIICVSSRWNL